MHWRRGYLDGLLWVLGHERAGTLRGDILWDQHLLPGRGVPVDADDCVYFHEPGNTRPCIINLGHVERVQIG